MFKPKQSWEEFLSTMPANQRPSLADMQQRWEEYDEREDKRFPERGKSQRVPKNVGERNMYSAWLLEGMEAEEASYFALNVLQPSKLIMLALVPEVRNLLAIDGANGDWQTDAETKLAQMRLDLDQMTEALRNAGLGV